MVYVPDPWSDFKNDCTQRLNGELCEVYIFLAEQRLMLWELWTELKFILQLGEREVVLLNGTAPVFCIKATNAMWKEIIAGIICFEGPGTLDQPKGYVSLKKLALLAKDRPSNKAVATSLGRLEQTIRNIRAMRNEHVSHWTISGMKTRKEMVVTIPEIEAALAVIDEVFLAFENNDNDWPRLFWTNNAPLPGGAKDLVRFLEAGRKAIN